MIFLVLLRNGHFHNVVSTFTYFVKLDVENDNVVLALGIFESKSGSRERGAIWQNIAENLNNFQEFAVTARSLRDHFTTLMKKYKLKTRQEVWGIGLKGEELCENSNFLKTL